MELDAEEAMPAPSWVQLSYLHNELGRALDYAGQYDKALGHYQKALAIGRFDRQNRLAKHRVETIIRGADFLPGSSGISRLTFLIGHRQGAATQRGIHPHR